MLILKGLFFSKTSLASRYHVILSNRQRFGRPSHRELSGKIREALALVGEAKWSPGNPAKLKANFDELEETFGIETALFEDQQKFLLAVLTEIRPEHYAGSYPPMRSYEAVVKGQDLFAFEWESEFFSAKMYFKFCVKGVEGRKRVFIMSIHPSSPNRE